MTSGEFRSQLVRRAELAKIDVSDSLAGQLEIYCRLLAHWNSRINLTALPLNPTTDLAVDRLFIEPLAAARYLPPESAVWFDVGSGGGSPAIPLRLVRQAGRLIMVESRERKAAFLREVVRALGLDGTSVEAKRIEDLADGTHMGTADLITVRAVKMESSLLEALRALIRLGGLILLFGAKPEQLLGLSDLETVPIGIVPAHPDLLMLKRTT